MVRIRKIHNTKRNDNGQPINVVVFEGNLFDLETGNIRPNVGATLAPMPGHVDQPESFEGKVVNGAHVERYLLTEDELERRREAGTDTWETPDGDTVEVKYGTRVSISNVSAYEKGLTPILNAISMPEGVTEGA